MGLSRSAYARHRQALGLPGATHTAVARAIAAGRILLEPDGTIDPAEADAAWAARSDPAKQRHAASPGPASSSSGPEAPPTSAGPSYAQSRAIREAYAARLAKLDYEERLGTLVPVAKVRLAWFQTLRALRARLLGLPARLAPLLAAETVTARAGALLEAELHALLEEAAEEVAGLGSGPPSSSPSP